MSTSMGMLMLVAVLMATALVIAFGVVGTAGVVVVGFGEFATLAAPIIKKSLLDA